MRFPPIARTKVVVYLMLTLVVLGLTLFFFFRPEPVSSLVKPKAEEATYRRGDDPPLYCVSVRVVHDQTACTGRLDAVPALERSNSMRR